jgi:hypothetical protein
MLQLLYFGVSKADGVLHLSSPTFCCIVLVCPPPVSVGHPYNVMAESLRIEGAAPFPYCHSGGADPTWSVQNGVQCTGVHADVLALLIIY